MGLFKKIILIIIITCSVLSVQSQSTKVYNDIDTDFKKAKESMLKGEISLAHPIFKKLYQSNSIESNFPFYLKSEVSYYYFVSSLMLNDNSVINDLKKYSETENSVARKQMMQYYLGEYYFKEKQYNLAIDEYANAGIANLSNKEIATMQFHKGYSYFATKQFSEAKSLFNSIRQIPNDINYIDANYYYGFICFYDKQYQEALKAFNITEQDDLYKNVVPFYIAEIYYFLGDRDRALTYSETILSKPEKQVHDLDFKQLVGHLYFDKKEYAKALPFLQYYVAQNEKVRREDLYQLSYCYYAAKNWNNAIDGFKQLGGKEDSLAQNSMYLLADAYLKTNQKVNARNAFLFCSSNSNNTFQKEVSWFNYAKLSYELGYLDIAITELQNFNNQNPKSNYHTETNELLVSALANTSNYKDALDKFEELPSKSDFVKKIYPRILYARATELINDRQISTAESLLDKIIAAPYNNLQIQFTFFWKGEIAYRNGRTNEAIQYFSKYLANPQINGEVNVTNAKYNLGYSYFKNERYKDALQNFEFITKYIELSSSAIEHDAFLRSGDCYYMLKSFNSAVKNYERVVNLNLNTADYASYQIAIIAGVTGKSKDKIAFLQNIATQYPNSNLVGEARLEIAKTYIADEDYSNAILPLQEILNSKKSSSLLPQVYLKLGICYFNLSKNNESLKYFTELTKQYPNTAEAENSIEYIRNIFIASQRTDEFINFMKANGKSISFSEEDSLSYQSAFIRFEERDTANAIAGMNKYLNKYSNGKFQIDANYILAEIYNNRKNVKEALAHYQTVFANAPNKYAENSVLQIARIYYFENKDFINAEKYFSKAKEIVTQQESRLEAMRGLLRCQYKLQNWREAEPNAKELLAEKTIALDDKMMAYLIIAKQSHSDLKLSEALSAYKQVVALGKSEFSAEASYRIAEIYFAQNNYSESEKFAFACIKKFGSYNYWLVKSYILLGDIYFKQNDLFNAEATYKSISENTAIAELKKEAQEKLEMVIQEKSKVNKVD